MHSCQIQWLKTTTQDLRDRCSRIVKGLRQACHKTATTNKKHPHSITATQHWRDSMSSFASRNVLTPLPNGKQNWSTRTSFSELVCKLWSKECVCVCAHPELRDQPASDSRVLGLKACTVMPSYLLLFVILGSISVCSDIHVRAHVWRLENNFA